VGDGRRTLAGLVPQAYRTCDGFPDDPTWPDRLVAVLHHLREHILKEQDGVFPAALVALDAEQWERIEAVRAQISTAATTSAANEGDHS